MTLSTTPLVDIDLATPPLPPLAIGLEPKEVLQVAGEDRETDVRLDEVGVLAEDNVPVASPVQGGPILYSPLPISFTKSAAYVRNVLNLSPLRVQL